MLEAGDQALLSDMNIDKAEQLLKGGRRLSLREV
jgi:hypothetical protein